MAASHQRKLKVAVLFGGRSGEHEVSLMSARSVLSVINMEKYDVIQVGITHGGSWLVGKDVLGTMRREGVERLEDAVLLADPSRPGLHVIGQSEQGLMVKEIIALDVVFPVLHGTFGEDGTLQGLLEMADVAYVGAGVLGSSVGMDKGVFKDVMRANNIPVVEAAVILRSEIEQDMETAIRKAEQVGAFPLFVKPANLGSSVGVSKCRTRSDLGEGLLEAAQYDRRVLVERAVANVREIEVSVLGNDQPEASIPGEIIPGADFYSYDAKYILDTSELIIPANISDKDAETVRHLSVQAFQAIDCAGMARVDFLVDAVSGDIYLNEVNTLPGFTQISMYPKLWEASGLPYEKLVDRLIELALERKSERDRTVHEFRRPQ